MPATVVNVPNPGTIKLPRGKPVNLGTLSNTVGSAVQFTIPEPTYFNQGGLVIAVSNGFTGTIGTFGLEASLDGGVSWFTVGAGTVISTSLFTDTTVSAAFAPINVNGFGSGALFRFGVITTSTGGTAAVWALVG